MRNSDPYSWIGFNNDPATTEEIVFWLRIGHTRWVYLWPWGIKFHKDQA